MLINKYRTCKCGASFTHWDTKKQIQHPLSGHINTIVCKRCLHIYGYMVVLHYYTLSKEMNFRKLYKTMEEAENKVRKVRTKWHVY